MQKEDRYLILKRKDIEKYLDDDKKSLLDFIVRNIRDCRAMDGKQDLDAVVVESDWPMYESTWDEIEAWVNSCENCHGTGMVDVGVGMSPCGCGA